MSTPDTPPAPQPAPPPGTTRSWTFLTNHGHVLLAVATNPDIRVKELAQIVGITTRHALLILRDLEDAGYVHRQRVGRATHYTVHSSRPFRHPTAAAHQVQELIAIFTESRDSLGRGTSTQ
jgi:DNA-binding MarR family transcriptional regulator